MANDKNSTLTGFIVIHNYGKISDLKIFVFGCARIMGSIAP
jgi:hypothetical protein